MPPDEVFIGSIDQGTTSTRFFIYDRAARPVGSHQIEFTQFYPQSGWVEHDPMEILESVRLCIAKAVDKATAAGHNVDSGLKAIGLTNQRETTVIWSKSRLSSLQCHRLDGRSYQFPLQSLFLIRECELFTLIKCVSGVISILFLFRKLEKELPGEKTHFLQTCGLPISTYFSALKVLWLLDNVDAVKEAVKIGDALFGTIDTWLIWNLTGGKENGLHVTDVSNASRTMLMNLKTLDWDETILDTLGIPAEILPKIVSNAEIIGNISKGWPIPGIPIAGCLGDQHAAMVGQGCRKGGAKSTFGTGAFILLNTGEEIVKSNHGLLSTLAYKLGPKAPTNYALEGSIAIAGAAVQWLRDSLGIIKSASEIEELASQVDTCGGITRFTNKSHIARAVLESMCFQVKDVLDSMHKDVGDKGEAKNAKGEFLLRVDGGATVNNLLMQIQADLLGTPVARPADIETTVRGAAYAAGLAIGIWTEKDIFSSGEEMDKPTIFRPVVDQEARKKKVDSWRKAVSRTFDLADLSL
ncbi:UNVERIFIED_CONTAM: Glycerol kinase [Sesamum radiatum]|uniref:glycerol kinase n=1 Tax=Sesamum radiatum TaxID=300843 RepID=A0AAW2PJZ5_SESRA